MALGLGLGGAFTRFGVTKGGFPAALGLQHLGLFFAFRLENGGLPPAFSLQNRGAFLTLGLHLPTHRIHQITGWVRYP